MNEDLSSVIEHALLYASPLPVTTAADILTTSVATVPFISQNDHTTLSNSTLASTSQLKSVQVLKTVPARTDASNEKTGAEVKHRQCIIRDKMTESVIEKFINDTLQVQNADFTANFGKEYDNANIANDLTFLSSAGATRLTQSEAMATPMSFHALPVQTNDEIANVSVSVPSDTPLVIPETNEANESLLEKTISTSVESPSGSDMPNAKKKRKREKNPDPRPEPFLPPCSICNEKSSGFHYGANTCEACKAFFRRTQKTQKLRFKCKCKPDEREEWKRGPIKNGCPACRYERCLMVGMSKNAIKIGRYTLNHKTKNINEIKYVESMDSLMDVAVSPMPESSSVSTSGLETGISSPGSMYSPASVDRSEVASSHSFTSPDLHDGRYAFEWTDSPHPAQHTVISLQEIDSIVKTLTEAHTRVPFDETFRIPLEVIKQKQTEYLEKYQLRTELFGDMGLSKEEFTEFYNITGIDLDGRIQHMDGAFQFFEQKIALVVAFAKSIPEFRTLKLDDQANLIKASRTENTLLAGYKGMVRNFDLDKRVVTTPWDKEIHMDELARLIPIDFLLMKVKYAHRLQDLNLTVQEESVIRAIVTLFSDRCSLEEPEKVERIQEKLVACLQHLLSIRPGGPGSLLYKIFNLITNFRDFTENETELTRKMLVDWPMLSANKYQLLKEFLT